MQVLDPGHEYLLETFDGDLKQVLQFMKREGPNYPGNVGTSPGTNIQEVIRALINRVKYLNGQLFDKRNAIIISLLRSCLLLLEHRAAERHGLTMPFIGPYENVEEFRTCYKCGHIICPDSPLLMLPDGSLRHAVTSPPLEGQSRR